MLLKLWQKIYAEHRRVSHKRLLHITKCNTNVYLQIQLYKEKVTTENESQIKVLDISLHVSSLILGG